MTSVSPVALGRVQSAIAQAANRSGVDFDYLLGEAKLESGLNASAHAGTSSASGLYQFLDQSWLAVVKKHGAANGMAWAADSIGRSSSGRLTVDDPATRQAIMGLRDDPTAASLMAAASATDNAATLQSALGRPANGTDLYMAHFLGPAGATKFLSAMASAPGATGAAMFPQAAAANYNVFYDKSGNARSLADIYQRFTDKLGQGASAGATQVQYAAQSLDLNGSTVITGNNQSAADALTWAQAALGRSSATQTAADVLRPTPDTARLAYLMLAGLGGA